MDLKTATFDVQRADERGHFDHGWLNTYHSFSFADYYDEKYVHWGELRVFNDDRVAPGEGFPPHPHRDMEILTYVLSGSLEHEDSMGNRGVVGPGGVQYMSAGTGVRHSEFNHSKTDGLHFVQMWVVPKRMGAAPRYGQKDFRVDDRLGRWLTVASGVSELSAPIEIGQSATFHVSRLEGGEVAHRFMPDRLGFLFVAEGDVHANGVALSAGDAVRIAAVEDLKVAGSGELLLWDVGSGR